MPHVPMQCPLNLINDKVWGRHLCHIFRRIGCTRGRWIRWLSIICNDLRERYLRWHCGLWLKLEKFPINILRLLVETLELKIRFFNGSLATTGQWSDWFETLLHSMDDSFLQFQWAVHIVSAVQPYWSLRGLVMALQPPLVFRKLELDTPWKQRAFKSMDSIWLDMLLQNYGIRFPWQYQHTSNKKQGFRIRNGLDWNAHSINVTAWHHKIGISGPMEKENFIQSGQQLKKPSCENSLGRVYN